jgi:hypothetical protein
MAEEKSILDKIENIPDQFFQYLLYVVLIIIILRPFGIPIQVSRPVKEFHDGINNLPPGSLVLVCNGEGLSGWTTRYPSIIAMFNHLFSRDLKPIIWCASPQSPLVIVEMLKFVDPENDFGAVYGEDWAFFGYLAGDESAFHTVAADFREAFSIDYYGNKIDDLPIMNGVNDMNDMAPVAILWTQTMEYITFFVRQMNLPFGTQAVGLLTGTQLQQLLPYYPDIYIGYLAAGGQSAAEYEMILNKPGLGLAFTDSLTVMYIMMFIIILLGNIVYFSRRSGPQMVKR